MDSMNANIPEVKSVEIIPVRAEGMDEKRLRFAYENKAAAVPEAMYLVKVYLKEGVPATGQGAALYIGDHWIRKYSGFAGGIFFNVYDPDFLQQNTGAAIRFSVDHETFHDTNVRLPSLPLLAATGAGAAVAAASLQSKADALKS